jgi:hypothetical protein
MERMMRKPRFGRIFDDPFERIIVKNLSSSGRI